MIFCSPFFVSVNQTDVEFKESYLKLANDVDEIARDIISHARDTEEVILI